MKLHTIKPFQSLGYRSWILYVDKTREIIHNSKQKLNLMFLRKKMMVLFWLCFTASFSSAQLLHSFNQIPVGNSDTNGFVRIDKVFYNIELGNGYNAELFFKFSSAPIQEPKYLGAYWTIPFFDSNVFKISPTKYRWIAPNLKTYTFNKVKKPDKGYKETYVLNTTGKLKLNIAQNNSIYIEDIGDQKNKFILKDGRLVSFSTGKDADIFKIRYGNRGVPQSMYNVSKNTTEVEFVYNKEGFLYKIILSKDKKALFITYGTCDTFATDGITKQGNFLKTISSITFADGKKEEYKYSAEVNKKDRCILTMRGKEKNFTKIPANRFEQKTGNNNNGFIEWDATTGIIVSDSGGTYAIRNPIFDKQSIEYGDSAFLAERKHELKTRESIISYKKPENKYEEIWDYSTKTAIKITQNSQTGEQTRTSYIGTFGNAAMKIRKIEKRSIDAKDWKMFVNKVYDADGDIIREKDSLGTLKEWKYEYIRGTKEMVSYSENSIPRILKKFNNNGKLEKILRLTPQGEEQEVFERDLKRFYLNGTLYKDEEYLSGKIQRVILYDNNEKQIINLSDLLQNP